MTAQRTADIAPPKQTQNVHSAAAAMELRSGEDTNARETSAGTSVIAHRTMRHLVLDIRKGFQRTLEAHGKFKSERLKLAQDLLQARARIEAGEEGDISWWAWFGKTFPQSRSDAEHLLAIAAAENPQARL